MSRDLFVGNLDSRVRREELEKLFAQLGAVQRVNIVNDRETGISKGFGFVTFADDASAEQAIAKFNGYEFCGKAIAISFARSKQDMTARRPWRGADGQEASPGIPELFVKGLSFDTSHDELRELFSPHGNVVKAKVISDRDTGESRGFGFVQMSTQAENDRAIAALDGKSMNGRILSVNIARERKPRAQGSRFDSFHRRGGY